MLEELKKLTNPEFEALILAEVIFKGVVSHELNCKIKFEYFSDFFYSEIYKACIKFSNLQMKFDPLILINHFTQDEKAEEFKQVIMNLSSNYNPMATCLEYAAIVTELHKRREILKSTSNFNLMLLDLKNIGDIKRIVFEHEKELIDALNINGSKEVTSLSEIIKEKTDLIRENLNNPESSSDVVTGINAFDNMLGPLSPSDLIIVAGRPSMGKTAFVTNIATNIALNKHKNPYKKGSVLFFSLEMSSQQIGMRILASLSTFDASDFKNNKLSASALADLNQLEQDLKGIPFYVDDSAMLTVDAIFSKAKRTKEIFGLDLIIIDYLQLIKGNSKGNDNRVAEISEISRNLKQLAKELNVPVIALSQLSRAVEQRECKRPLLSDLRESGAIEQDADIVLFIYREEYYLSRSAPPMEESKRYAEWSMKLSDSRGKAELVVAKNRHGKTGIANMKFDEFRTKFS